MGEKMRIRLLTYLAFFSLSTVTIEAQIEHLPNEYKLGNIGFIVHHETYTEDPFGNGSNYKTIYFLCRKYGRIPHDFPFDYMNDYTTAWDDHNNPYTELTPLWNLNNIAIASKELIFLQAMPPGFTWVFAKNYKMPAAAPIAKIELLRLWTKPLNKSILCNRHSAPYVDIEQKVREYETNNLKNITINQFYPINEYLSWRVTKLERDEHEFLIHIDGRNTDYNEKMFRLYFFIQLSNGIVQPNAPGESGIRTESDFYESGYGDDNDDEAMSFHRPFLKVHLLPNTTSYAGKYRLPLVNNAKPIRVFILSANKDDKIKGIYYLPIPPTLFQDTYYSHYKPHTPLSVIKNQNLAKSKKRLLKAIDDLNATSTNLIGTDLLTSNNYLFNTSDQLLDYLNEQRISLIFDYLFLWENRAKLSNMPIVKDIAEMVLAKANMKETSKILIKRLLTASIDEVDNSFTKHIAKNAFNEMYKYARDHHLYQKLYEKNYYSLLEKIQKIQQNWLMPQELDRLSEELVQLYNKDIPKRIVANTMIADYYRAKAEYLNVLIGLRGSLNKNWFYKSLTFSYGMGELFITCNYPYLKGATALLGIYDFNRDSYMIEERYLWTNDILERLEAFGGDDFSVNTLGAIMQNTTNIIEYIKAGEKTDIPYGKLILLQSSPNIIKVTVTNNDHFLRTYRLIFYDENREIIDTPLPLVSKKYTLRKPLLLPSDESFSTKVYEQSIVYSKKNPFCNMMAGESKEIFIDFKRETKTVYFNLICKTESGYYGVDTKTFGKVE